MSYNPSLDLILDALGLVPLSETEEAMSEGELEQERAISQFELPRFMRPSREAFEALGFKFEDIADDPVLCKARLPEGWTLQSEGRTAYIVDEKRRKRAKSFYNGTFAERYGEMKLLPRYSLTYKHINPEKGSSPVKVCAVDADGTVIFETEKHAENYSDEYWKLYRQAESFLTSHYPDWEDGVKYWD